MHQIWVTADTWPPWPQHSDKRGMGQEGVFLWGGAEGHFTDLLASVLSLSLKRDGLCLCVLCPRERPSTFLSGLEKRRSSCCALY